MLRGYYVFLLMLPYHAAEALKRSSSSLQTVTNTLGRQSAPDNKCGIDLSDWRGLQ